MSEILLLNPWITDFAAYDLWARPLGLLYIGACLRRLPGVGVRLLDCLDHARLPPGLAARVRRRADGRGHYHREIIAKPEPLRGIKRHYCRYGIPEEVFRQCLRQLPTPDVVLVTSRMTYWYPGVQRAIAIVREELPTARVVLGGLYPTLCPRHARQFSGADAIVSGTRLEPLLALLASWKLVPPPAPGADHLFSVTPAWDLYDKLSSLVLLTSLGCPGRCPYCAAARLWPVYQRRAPGEVFAELRQWRTCFPGLRDVAFYDDALLLDADRHLLPFLELVGDNGGAGLRFHTPNGLHVPAAPVGRQDGQG
ncbi:MAG: cobalamin-dependent protein [Deltaproteobacteria bacterium]|nr:cobalamin-dependent protein [Deltaproteobacteria bacterium]